MDRAAGGGRLVPGALPAVGRSGARPVTAGLGLSSALRGVADGRGDVVLHGRDGSLRRGVLDRVGADFVEVRVDEGRVGDPETLPFGGIAAVRSP